ncbi:MAG TPA: sugar ABC transporter permease [Chloroflexota bacterium]|nr:sugar ABC transporter permease [Chloroflexota bacterium]
MTAFRRVEALWGFAFVLPAVLGLVIFQLGPVLASLYLSFTSYDIVSPPKWIGLANYQRMFAEDLLYRKSLGVTTYYSLLSIPLSLVVAYLIALLMNQRVRGIAVYRTLWYLPSLVPATVNGVLWLWLLNRDFGPVNYFLRLVGLPAPAWLSDPNWTIPSLVLVHLWAVGNSILIFLAGLQGVPQHLYEAAEVDGATWWDKLRHVTLPMTSSIVFFNLVIGIIQSFQVFALVYTLYTPSPTEATSAGPENAALVYVMYLYRNAFQNFRNGYASAMAWVLLLIIMALTLVVFRTQGRWVYYEATRRK